MCKHGWYRGKLPHLWQIYFLLGDNESNYNFWDQGINLKGGRIALDIFIYLLLLPNSEFWASESRVLEEKLKDVIHDSN